MRVVGLVTIAVVAVLLVVAVVDVRSLLADRPPVAAPSAAAASAGTRGASTETQVAVRVTFTSTGPFTATVVDESKKERTFTSDGEDVVFTRVYEGEGPYLFASAQASTDATLGCRIEIDGRRAASDETSGLYTQTFCAA